MTRARALAAGLAVLTTAAVAPAAADAKANPYTPTRVCGAGYKVVKTQQLPHDAARIYLLRKPGTRQLCATTIKRTKVGVPTSMLIWLSSLRHHPRDEGSFSYYAGPIKWRNTPGDCPTVYSGMTGGTAGIFRIGKGCG